MVRSADRLNRQPSRPTQPERPLDRPAGLDYTGQVASIVLAPAELDPASSAAFGARLTEFDPGDDVVVDFSDVVFCDSSGIRVLLQGVARHQPAGGSFQVVNVAPQVARIFEIVRVHDLLQIGHDAGARPLD